MIQLLSQVHLASAVFLSLQPVFRPFNLGAGLLEFFVSFADCFIWKARLSPALEIPIVLCKVKSIFHSDLALTLLSVLS